MIVAAPILTMLVTEHISFRVGKRKYNIDSIVEEVRIRIVGEIQKEYREEKHLWTMKLNTYLYKFVKDIPYENILEFYHIQSLFDQNWTSVKYEEAIKLEGFSKPVAKVFMIQNYIEKHWDIVKDYSKIIDHLNTEVKDQLKNIREEKE